MTRRIFGVVFVLLGTTVLLLQATGLVRVLLHVPLFFSDPSSGKAYLAQPGQLSAIIGELIIGSFPLGIIDLIPAFVLFIALLPLKVRSRWSYFAFLFSGCYLLCLVPIGTITGIALLMCLRRRKSEFSPDTVKQVNQAAASNPQGSP